jgi:DNA-binding MarR family transcriptional regulator
VVAVPSPDRVENSLPARARDGAAATADGDANSGSPSRTEIDAVMLGAQLLVAISAQSVAAVETEVSLPQLRLLVILASRGAQSLNEVARNLEIHASNATRACDRVVEAGLVRRQDDPNDRRLLQLTLTRRGEQLVERVMDHRRRHIEQLLAQMPSDQRAALAEAMRAFAASGAETLERAAWRAGWTTAGTDDG